MNDQLQDTVNTILKDAVDKASQGAEFLKEQIPDILKQLIAWNIAADLVWITLAAFVIGLGIKCLLNAEKNFDDAENPPWMVISIASWIASFPAIGIGITCVLELLKLWIAPKVWLLEYAAHLVKHGN